VRLAAEQFPGIGLEFGGAMVGGMFLQNSRTENGAVPILGYFVRHWFQSEIREWQKSAIRN
jgi:hypothetical protein